MWAWDKIQNNALRILIVTALCAVTAISDWKFFSVIFILAFGINRGNIKKQLQCYAIIVAVKIVFDVCFLTMIGKDMFSVGCIGIERLGMFCVIPLLALYNGQRGKGGKFSKWFFYVFYPLHLLVLGLVLSYFS